MIPHIYCLTFRNPVKRQRIITRFQDVGLSVGLSVSMVEGIPYDDPLIEVDPATREKAIQLNRWSEMAWSCIHGHLLIIDKFLASGEPLAIVMEDDVMVSTNFVQEVQQVVENFQELNLDMLLLGYLSPNDFAQDTENVVLEAGNFKYLAYQWNVYGTQMYMISRPYAQYVQKTFGFASGFGRRCLTEPELISFNADWIITKNGRRAMVYPMLAIEELGGGKSYNDPFQEWWHDHCHKSQVTIHPNRWI